MLLFQDHFLQKVDSDRDQLIRNYFLLGFYSAQKVVQNFRFCLCEDNPFRENCSLYPVVENEFSCLLRSANTQLSCQAWCIVWRSPTNVLWIFLWPPFFFRHRAKINQIFFRPKPTIDVRKLEGANASKQSAWSPRKIDVRCLKCCPRIMKKIRHEQQTSLLCLFKNPLSKFFASGEN